MSWGVAREQKLPLADRDRGDLVQSNPFGLSVSFSEARRPGALTKEGGLMHRGVGNITNGDGRTKILLRNRVTLDGRREKA